MKKTLLQRLGLLGVVSFLSYTAAVVFAPLAYPGYNWMAQAVSDLSAAKAPSLALWNQLSALYNVCEVVCVTVVCIGIQGRKTKLLRSGIYLFAVMEWISAVGHRMFPLGSSRLCAQKKNRPRAVLFSHICGTGFFSSSSRRCSSPIMSSKAVKSALSTSSWAARSCWDRAAFIVR